MKKVYSKPDVFFEDFSLSTNIAAGCEEKANFAEETCGLEVEFTDTITVTLLNGDISACAPECDPKDYGYNNLCYHNPSEDYNLYNS